MSLLSIINSIRLTKIEKSAQISAKTSQLFVFFELIRQENHLKHSEKSLEIGLEPSLTHLQSRYRRHFDADRLDLGCVDITTPSL